MTELLTQFHFLRPLWLVAILPTAIVWWKLYRGRDPRLGLSDDIAPHLLNRLVTKPRDLPRIRPVTMALPLGIIATLVLAGPSFRQKPSPFAEDDAQLIVVTKITPSMLTDDLRPSRLERVRTKIHDLLQMRNAADTGLVAYAGSAHLVMPATSDGDVINHMLESLDPKVMPTQGDGDALVSALQIASEQLKNSTAQPDGATTGSILVVADSVQQAQLELIRQWRETNQTAVQFFVPLREQVAFDQSGIPEAARVLSAETQQVTADDTDIQIITRRADRAFVSSTNNESMQWYDDGYFFIPLLALGILLWCRKGWSID